MGIYAYPLIVVALDPGHQAQKGQDLGLDAQGDVEVLDDVVDAQRHTGPGPEHHHGGLEAGRMMAAVVDDDLRDELVPG